MNDDKLIVLEVKYGYQSSALEEYLKETYPNLYFFVGRSEGSNKWRVCLGEVSLSTISAKDFYEIRVLARAFARGWEIGYDMAFDEAFAAQEEEAQSC